jgi:hypothetical protein
MPVATEAGTGMLALFGTLVQAQANKDAVVFKTLLERGASQGSTVDQTMIASIVKALLDRGATPQGPNSLEVLREIKPFLGGGGGGATELIKGIEIGRGLTPPIMSAPQEEDLGSMLTGILKLIAPMQKSPEVQPAPAAPPASPPAAAPPWAYMPFGWSPPGAMSSEQMFRAALSDPSMRERLRGMLQEVSPPVPQSPPGPPAMPAMPPTSVPAAAVPGPVQANPQVSEGPVVPVAMPDASRALVSPIELEPPEANSADGPIAGSRNATQADFLGLFSAMLPPDAYAAVFPKKEGK